MSVNVLVIHCVAGGERRVEHDVERRVERGVERGAEYSVELSVPEGSTLEQAVVLSGLLDRVPALRGAPLDLGVWNVSAPAGQRVREGDRIEVYRPLKIDPKQARRLRAEARRRTRSAH